MEVCVDGISDDANRVGWLLMEIDTDFLKNVIDDVVGRVGDDDIISRDLGRGSGGCSGARDEGKGGARAETCGELFEFKK